MCCWAAKCEDGVQGSARCGDWATKVCCGAEKCEDGVGSAKCGEGSTKVCCGVEKFAVGAAGLEKCGGWIEASAKYVGLSTKVCCGAENCGDGVAESAKCGEGAAGVTKGCRKGWKLAGSGWVSCSSRNCSG